MVLSQVTLPAAPAGGQPVPGVLAPPEREPVEDSVGSWEGV